MKKSSVFKTLKTVKNILCWLLIAVLVFMMIIFFVSRINGETPEIFGYSIFRVSSGSMEPELSVGDVILDKAVDNPEDLKVGDIITFRGSGATEGKIITHKIIVAPKYENGRLMLQTKGTANDIPDEPMSADRIKGIMLCKLSFLNVVYEVFLSPWGLLILIALVALVFFDEIIVIVRILTGNDKSVKEAESINDIIDRIQEENRLNKEDTPETICKAADEDECGNDE